MYCGRLEEALEYAQRGAQEEPDYPWIWLQVGNCGRILVIQQARWMPLSRD